MPRPHARGRVRRQSGGVVAHPFRVHHVHRLLRLRLLLLLLLLLRLRLERVDAQERVHERVQRLLLLLLLLLRLERVVAVAVGHRLAAHEVVDQLVQFVVGAEQVVLRQQRLGRQRQRLGRQRRGRPLLQPRTPSERGHERLLVLLLEGAQLQTPRRELLLLLLLLQTVLLLLLLLLPLLLAGRRGRLELRRRVRRLRRRGRRGRRSGRLLRGRRPPPKQAAEGLAVGHRPLPGRHLQQVDQRLVLARSDDAAPEVDDEPLGQVAPRGRGVQRCHELTHS